MPTTPGTRTNEITRLQGEITSEIARDAPNIAQGVFGDNKNHPDMAQVSNQHLDDLYRSKYQANDRAWLQAEARRDPVQFEKVTDRLGVPTPPPGSPPPQAPGAALNKILSNAQSAQAAPAPAGPAAMPGSPTGPGIPMALPAPPQALAGGVASVPPPPPPVILGPNGQPLPPSGM